MASNTAEIRAFIAIEIPTNIAEELEGAKQSLATRLKNGEVKWVKSENIHLTLRFLGNVHVSKLPSIYKSLDQAAALTHPFSLELGAVGCFPNPRRPRVVWIGLKGDLDLLSAIQKQVEQALIPLGWDPEDRRFHPHLTLGRVKDSRALVEARFPWGEEITSGSFNVDQIHLAESQLLPTGAVYTIKHSALLMA